MTEETQETVSQEDTPTDGAPSSESRTLGMLAHLLGIMGFLGPLIIWLIKKDDEPFVDDQGKEALNFQITVLIGLIVSGLLTFICVGFFTAAAIAIGNIVLCIMAALKANEGETYRYPFTLRLIK